MALVDVVQEDPRWEAVDLASLAELACRATLRELGLAAERFEISVLACDDRRITRLNADFRGRAQATNVLSWPSAERAAKTDGGQPESPGGSAEAPGELGDIAIAFDTCQCEARRAGRPLRDHSLHLLVHGCLHLLGYDHVRVRDAALMQAIEVQTLAQLGLVDPYEEDASFPGR